VTNNETSILRCRRLIEASLQWGDPSSWSNEDFEELSEKIYMATDVRLSVSTLKRIWGKVRYDSSPTAATLNALARFAGFENWREFIARTDTALASHPISSVQPPTSADPAASSFAEPAPPASADPAASFSAALILRPDRRRMRMGLLIVLCAAIIGLLSLFGSRLKQHPAGAVANLSFDARQASDDLPNSVVFHYDASTLHPEKLMIQQSWDTTRREAVAPDSKAHTSLYYYPGFFTARLIADGQTVRKTDVFIRTKGWKGIIEKEPLPIYLKEEEIKDHYGLQVSAATLQQKTGAALFNGTWVEFNNVRDFGGMAADDFTFTTTLRNTATVEQCLCRAVKIFILGTSSAIIIPLSDKGCISELNLLTGCEMILGKDHDLSAFGCDFRQPQQLECSVKDHRLKIRLNKTQILDVAQQRSIGKIIGIRVAFEGPGEIREMHLEGGTGQNYDLLQTSPDR
jgi:hypothetical protein